MSWLKTKFSSSFFALFATSQPALIEAGPQCGMEDIRTAMLALVDGVNNPQIERRLTYAHDIDGLWYLRGELMSVLAPLVGEAAALEKILHITAMFQQAHPERFKSRLKAFKPAGKAGSAP